MEKEDCSFRDKCGFCSHKDFNYNGNKNKVKCNYQCNPMIEEEFPNYKKKEKERIWIYGDFKKEILKIQKIIKENIPEKKLRDTHISQPRISDLIAKLLKKEEKWIRDYINSKKGLI